MMTPGMMTGRQRMRRVLAGLACAGVMLAASPAALRAQNAGGPPPAQAQGPGAQDQGYTPDQLNALMAPVALYPDQLLTQILMASAYPDDVHAANDWLRDPQHAQLQGDALAQALQPLPWQPAVKALVPFPQVLGMMVSQQDWMAQVAYAMSVQQPAVMASVQQLREQAQRAGHLQSCEQYTVSGPPGQIVIAPPAPDAVYVPVYDPTVVYGGWGFGVRPWIWAAPPGFYFSPLYGGFAFSARIGIVAPLWGFAGFHWGYGGGIFVNAGAWNAFAVGHPWVGGGFWHPVGVGFARPGFGFRAGPAFRPEIVTRANTVNYNRNLVVNRNITVVHNNVVNHNVAVNHNVTVNRNVSAAHGRLPAVQRPSTTPHAAYPTAASRAHYAAEHAAAPRAPAFRGPAFHAPEYHAPEYHAPGGAPRAEAARPAARPAPRPAAPHGGGGERHR